MPHFTCFCSFLPPAPHQVPPIERRPGRARAVDDVTVHDEQAVRVVVAVELGERPLQPEVVALGGPARPYAATRPVRGSARVGSELLRCGPRKSPVPPVPLRMVALPDSPESRTAPPPPAPGPASHDGRTGV